MSDLVSEEYKGILEHAHKDVKWGGCPSPYIYEICNFIREHGVFFKDVLDYGCGKGVLRHVLGRTVNVTNYDPGVKEFSALPSQKEYVVCVDVMEHVELDRLDNVVRHIAELTGRKAFFVISITPSKKILQDGRNAHLTIMTIEEWITLLGKYFNMISASTGLDSLRYTGSPKRAAPRPTRNNRKPSTSWRR